MQKKKGSKSKKAPVHALPVIRAKVAGIDIGSREHWVCGPAQANGEPNVRVFATTTPQLTELTAWLREQGVESVAMESTSVYWIPLYEMLEAAGIEVVLVNARELRAVPGRKTDMRDCQWLQLLHSCGLLRGSFRPNESIGALRALQRQCANLVAERSRAVQWMQKALEQERASPSCRHRHHRHHGACHRARHLRGRARPAHARGVARQALSQIGQGDRRALNGYVAQRALV